MAAVGGVMRLYEEAATSREKKAKISQNLKKISSNRITLKDTFNKSFKPHTKNLSIEGLIDLERSNERMICEDLDYENLNTDRNLVKVIPQPLMNFS